MVRPSKTYQVLHGHLGYQYTSNNVKEIVFDILVKDPVYVIMHLKV